METTGNQSGKFPLPSPTFFSFTSSSAIYGKGVTEYNHFATPNELVNLDIEQ